MRPACARLGPKAWRPRAPGCSLSSPTVQTHYKGVGMATRRVLARMIAFAVAIVVGEAMNHPLIHMLWAGPVRLAYLYPQTVEGQNRALIDLNTVGLVASITT